jgi:cytochrome c-type biogenesis protein CcmF
MLGIIGGAALLGFWSGLRDHEPAARLARRALYAAAAMVAFASGWLVAALVSHDFAIAFVAEHTDRATPVPLLVAAFYSGQAGSLLYWTLVLTVLGSIAIAAAPGTSQLRGFATGVIATVATFFILVLTFVANPFDLLTTVPADGAGLNPLLRDGGMLIHPPFLLGGFSSFALPFSFTVATLLAGRADADWLAATRRLALLSWGLQGVGLTLGMWWAYHVLGWGGYWGWDPVENVALLPWLATTAYIHSSQVEERRRLLRGWNFGLLLLAFCLSVFGTFVVRSGVIQSVHSFVASDVGPWFFGFLVAAVGLSSAALAWRSRTLGDAARLEPRVSREAAFLLNNLVLIALAAAIFWGTVLPVFSQLMTGQQAVVGASFYERVSAPLFLALLALLAVGPLLPWRGGGTPRRRLLPVPAIAAAAVGAGLVAGGVTEPGAILAFAAIGAAVSTVLIEYLRVARLAAGAHSRHLSAAARLLVRNRRRYGAYLAHLGILIVAAGIAGSHFFQQERQVVLRPQQTVAVGRYALQYTGSSTSTTGDAVRTTAAIRLGDERLEPSRTVYGGAGGQSSTHVAIRSTPLEDLYVVLASAGNDGSATLLIFVNPMVTWIWVGAALLVGGVLLGHLKPVPQTVPVRSAAARKLVVRGAE